jgi:hypothetical protein
LGAAVDSAERVDARFEIRKVKMAEVAARDLLGKSSSGGWNIVEEAQVIGG